MTTEDQLLKLQSLEVVPTDVISIIDVYCRRQRLSLSGVKWSTSSQQGLLYDVFDDIFVFGEEGGRFVELTIHKWNPTSSAFLRISGVLTRFQNIHPFIPMVAISRETVYIVTRKQKSTFFQCDCFNFYGILKTSFDIQESFENSSNIKIQIFNDFLWVSQYQLVRADSQPPKTDLTFLRKFSTLGKLLSTFVINQRVAIFCIDSSDEYLYTYFSGYNTIFKFKLGCDGKTDDNHRYFITNPTEQFSTDIHNIYQMYCDPVWNSLIVFANWGIYSDHSQVKYDHRCSIYEIYEILKKRKIRKICTADDFKIDVRGFYTTTCILRGTTLIKSGPSGTMWIE